MQYMALEPLVISMRTLNLARYRDSHTLQYHLCFVWRGSEKRRAHIQVSSAELASWRVCGRMWVGASAQLALACAGVCESGGR